MAPPHTDCLYLNLWTLTGVDQPVPVMVFIHGGGNVQGATSQESLGTYLFDGQRLAERGQVVVVTIQYRLGGLGFLALPESIGLPRPPGRDDTCRHISAISATDREIRAGPARHPARVERQELARAAKWH